MSETNLYDDDTRQLLDESPLFFEVKNLQKARVATSPDPDLVILCSGILDYKGSVPTQKTEVAIVVPDHQIDNFVRELLNATSLPLEEKIALSLNRMTEELSCLNQHINTYLGKLSNNPSLRKSAGGEK